MRLVIVLLSLAACAPKTGELVSAAQLLPSTLPIAPDGYDLGQWVTADGCDDLEHDFSVADVVRKAQGQYDALVNVTVEQFDRVVYKTNYKLQQEIVAVNARCFRVTGRGATRSYPAAAVPLAPAPVVPAAMPVAPAPVE